MVNHDENMVRLKQEITSVGRPKMKANIMKAAIAAATPKHRAARRAGLIATIIIALLAVSGTVMAVAGMTFEELMQRVQTPFAGLLHPTTAVCEDQGIRMEMTALGYYDKMAKFYITVQDLEGDRIDENTIFFAFVQDGSSSGRAVLVDYDKETGIASYEFTATSEESFADKPIIFEVTELIYNEQELLECYVDMDLSKVEQNPDTIIMDINSGNSQLFEDNDQIDILKPDQQIVDFSDIDFAGMAGAGIIAGKLHIQFWQDPSLNEYSGVQPYLKKKNADGTYSASTKNPGRFFKEMYPDRIYPKHIAYFNVNDAGEVILLNQLTEANKRFTDYVFDIDIQDLAQYGLFADFQKNDVIQGKWTLESRQDAIKAYSDMECDVAIGETYVVKHISIGPFGIVIDGIDTSGDLDYEAAEEIYKIPCKMQTSHGIVDFSWKTYFGSTLTDSKDEFNITKIAGEPIDVSDVEALIINGVTIPIEKEE